jgi:hypothetical protein
MSDQIKTIDYECDSLREKIIQLEKEIQTKNIT